MLGIGSRVFQRNFEPRHTEPRHTEPRHTEPPSHRQTHRKCITGRKRLY